MDLRTMVKELLRAIHIDDSAAGDAAEIDAKIAIVKAIRSNRSYRLGFNDKWHTIGTEANKVRYALPDDFLGIVKDYIYSIPAGNYVAKSRLRSYPLSHLLMAIESSLIHPVYKQNGVPSAYTIDSSTSEIVIAPTPSSAGDIIEFLYLSDLGSPIYSFDGTNWGFFFKNSTEPLPDDWSNEWLDEDKGYDLIFNWAAHKLLSTTYGGNEESAAKAAQHYEAWMSTLSTLRKEAAMNKSVHAIVRHI